MIVLLFVVLCKVAGVTLLTLVLPKGGGYHPVENFSLSPQNQMQEESNLRHLGNLSDIFRAVA